MVKHYINTADFIIKINQIIKDYNEVLKSKDIDDFQEKIIKVDSGTYPYKVFEIVNNYKNLNELPFPYFSFLEDIQDYEKAAVFGINPTHGFFYAINKETNQVIAVNEDGDFVYNCSQEETSFLECMILILELEISYLKQEEKAYDNSYREKVFEKCIAISGGNENGDFFKLILSIGRN